MSYNYMKDLREPDARYKLTVYDTRCPATQYTYENVKVIRAEKGMIYFVNYSEKGENEEIMLCSDTLHYIIKKK